MFFHLSTLAADAIDQIALSTGGGAAWHTPQRLHAWLAWLMKAPAALVRLSMLLMVAFGAAAPNASDIGAVEWVNPCCSGIYVERFLWTPPGDQARLRVAVFGPKGKVDAQRAGDCMEFCLGAGAHTHYLSNDAVALAVEIDRLIAG